MGRVVSIGKLVKEPKPLTARESFLANERINDIHGNREVDNAGQIIVYTGLFQWMDGTVRRSPDPDWKE